MKMYDSLATINFAHSLMNKLGNEVQKVLFSNALRALFDKKQVSEEGEYDTFKITRKDVESVYKELYG